MEGGLGELVGEEAEPGDVGGPADAGRHELAQRHLEGVAGLGTLDEHGSRDRVDPREVEVAHAVDGRAFAELAGGGIRAFEVDGLPTRAGERGRKVPVPAEMMLRTVDGVVTRDAH